MYYTQDFTVAFYHSISYWKGTDTSGQLCCWMCVYFVAYL